MSDIFNSPFEISLRILLILEHAKDKYYSTDMLASIDFISVYGCDFGIANSNLHGDSLFKYSEFATRRVLVQDAVKKLVLKGLISVSCNTNGFTYSNSSIGITYCKKLESDYANTYREVVSKTINFIQNKSEKVILNIINEHSIRSLKKGFN